MKKFIIFILLLALPVCVNAQENRDYNWIIGGFSSGDGLRLTFSPNLSSIELNQTGIEMEGSNTSMSDKNGNLLFYSNGCKIINANAEIMQNGDEINPGYIQTAYCDAGGSPHVQGVISLPIPESDSLYLVFNLDLDNPYQGSDTFFPVAPQKLYYQVIDMSQDSGRGAVIQKNQIAVQDTFARGNISAVRHENGKDWWVIVPKSHSNCYFLIPVTDQGVQAAQLKCSGFIWSDKDAGAQAVFSPNGDRYIRFNARNGLNIFNFDNSTGNLSNPLKIDFPNDTINAIAGVSVSPNSQYLYVSARKKVYQFDLFADSIEFTKEVVAVWDGFYNPYATIFYLSALAPDGKIYISSTSSTLNLHVIERPNCPGISCQLVQHGITLPSYNFATIPNFPHYRQSVAGCDSIINTLNEDLVKKDMLTLYPNPTKGLIHIDFQGFDDTPCHVQILDMFGRKVMFSIMESNGSIDISMLPNGTYYCIFQSKTGNTFRKIVKVEPY